MRTRAYKGFRMDSDGKLWCRDFQYVPGKTYRQSGVIMLCENGFHACEELYQCFEFYPNNGENVFYEVECDGVVTKPDRGKFACSKIRLVREIPIPKTPLFTNAYTLEDVGLGIVGRGSSFHNTREYNFIKKDCTVLLDEWVRDIGFFNSGFAKIGNRKRKYNFTDKEGNLLYYRWFDSAQSFEGKYARVVLDGKNYTIDTRGNLIDPKTYAPNYSIG